MTKGVRTGLIWAGVVLSYIGNLFNSDARILFAVVGMALVLWGCYIWCKLKNRNIAWGLFGLLAPIGLIVLCKLRDKTPLPQVKIDKSVL
ncbi:MAG: hypothetical protein PHI12_08290 [Dehalococcoidales bacterium]|nr:hypothetical protein [Dehalococcoidales bacterium]